MQELIRGLSLLTLIVLISWLAACRCVSCDDDVVLVEEQAWEATDLTTDNRIIALHATATELLVFTPTEYLRTSPTGSTIDVIEKRQFLPLFRTLGRPAVNDLVFARASLNTTTNAELLEFQLTQTGAGSVEFAIDSLTPELVAVEQKAAAIGAFSSNGRVYVQPVILRDTRSLSLMFFELDYNSSFTRFDSVTFAGMVAIPGVLEDDQVVSNIKYLDGNFYLATKRGGYRVSESGVVELVINNSTWVRDFFKYDGDYYATQIGVGAVLQSSDGRNFERGNVLEIALVQVLGDHLVSQDFEGYQYEITPSLEVQTRPLKLNDDFPLQNDIYFGLDRLDNNFYLGVDRQVWRAEELQPAE